MNNIEQITRHFNWPDFGALTVCPDDESKTTQYAIIDGQHRYRAAEAAGIPEVPCVIISRRGMADQAVNFVSINTNRVRLTPLAEYHASVAAKNPDCVALAAILKRCKIEIAHSSLGKNAMPPRVTCAIGTLTAMLVSYSEKQIVWALTIIPDAYEEKPGMLTANLIKMLAQFIKDKPETDRDIMIDVLRDTDAEQLEKDARAFRQIERVSTVTAMTRVLDKKYSSFKRQNPKVKKA